MKLLKNHLTPHCPQLILLLSSATYLLGCLEANSWGEATTLAFSFLFVMPHASIFSMICHKFSSMDHQVGWIKCCHLNNLWKCLALVLGHSRIKHLWVHAIKCVMAMPPPSESIWLVYIVVLEGTRVHGDSWQIYSR